MLARVTYHLSNSQWIDWESPDNAWFLKWLDVSADFTTLRSFFSIKTPTIWATYEKLCLLALSLQRPLTARILFEIQDTMRKNSSITADGVNFLEIAVYLRPKASEMLEVAKRALEYATQSLHRSKIRTMFLFAASRLDITIMRLLVGLVPPYCGEVLSTEPSPKYLDLVIRQVCLWEPNERKDGATLADYIQLLIQGDTLLTSLSERCYCNDRAENLLRHMSSLTVDELVMLCPPMKRSVVCSAILPWSNNHMSFLSKAGVFSTAVEGSQDLLQYLRTCKQHDAFETRKIMQECLLFAAILNDTQTLSATLQLGVDPQVSILLNNEQPYHKRCLSRSPVIVAAAAGNLESLKLLTETVSLVELLKSFPFYEVIRQWDRHNFRDATGGELCRLRVFREGVTRSQKHHSDDTVANGTVRDASLLELNTKEWLSYFLDAQKRMGTITWIRRIAAAHGMVKSVDKEIIKAAMFNDPKFHYMIGRNKEYHPCDILLLDDLLDGNLDYHEGDMDLLQLGIRAQCNLKFVKCLLSKGLQVHSRAGQDGNTMLHDALLSRSYDRSQIVHLLLREGSEYKQCGEGLTVLEASLHGVESAYLPQSYLDIFTHLFDAGAPVRQRPRPELKERQPMICQLLRAKAEDDLILRVVDAGVNLNERGNSWHRTPLVAAISSDREKLARELIRRGADVHSPAGDARGLTALQAACWVQSSLEFVKYLVIVQGANVNEAPGERNGYTALQLAAMQGSLSVAEFLLDNDADINALSHKTWYYGQPTRCRALDTAAYTGGLDMVEFLLKAGGRSATAGLDGAIAAAKFGRHFAVVSVLLEWKKKHGRRILEAEAEWQRKHPDEAGLLSQP